MTHGLPRAGLILFLASLWACGPTATAAMEQGEISPRERTIVVGRVSHNPNKAHPRLEKLASYLAQRLEPLGISAGDVLIAGDNQEMISYLRQGKVDLVSETSLSAILFSEEAGAEILLREWRKGVPTYQTILFARKGAGIASPADLRGRKIGFEGRGSTSGFLVTLALLRREGLEPVELSSPQDEPPAGKVGYAFATSEPNVVKWVVRGLVDAGAIGIVDRSEIDRMPERLRERLDIFHTSEPFIRSLFLARGELSPEIKAAVKGILLDMHDDPEGKTVLETYFQVNRFDEIRGPVAESLDDARNVFALVRSELE